MSIFKMQKSELENKLKELSNKKNYRESRVFKNLTKEYDQLINKIDLYQSTPDDLISNSNLSREGVKYLENPHLSIRAKLDYIEIRREHLKKQLKTCTCNVFNIFC